MENLSPNCHNSDLVYFLCWLILMTKNEDCSGIPGVNKHNNDIEQKENLIKIWLFLWSVYYLVGIF